MLVFLGKPRNRHHWEDVRRYLEFSIKGAMPCHWPQAGKMMDTDEYEISLAREINVCKRVIKETQSKLAARRQQFGVDFPQAALAVAEGTLAIDQQDLAEWSDDFEALPQWRQRLEQYYEALAIMRVSGS